MHFSYFKLIIGQNFVLDLEKLLCRKYNSYPYSLSKLKCNYFESNTGIVKAVVPIFFHCSYLSQSSSVNVTAMGSHMPSMSSVSLKTLPPAV